MDNHLTGKFSAVSSARRLGAGLDRVLGAVMVACLASMVLLVFVNVVMRYALNVAAEI